MTTSHDYGTNPKALAPGTRMLWHKGSSVVVLMKRKPDDSGWWLADNRGGLDDSVIRRGDWRPAGTPPVARTVQEVAAEWFIQKYHLRYLADCLNTGRVVDENWQPHVGERSQANADAELLLVHLAAHGFHIDGDRA